jgi:phosphomannomutase
VTGARGRVKLPGPRGERRGRPLQCAAVSVFKAYDVRGLAPGELDADLARRIGRATARHLGARALAVGRDARTSSPELAEALAAGLNDEGVEVVDLGLVGTPMVYFAVEDLGLDGGVMVTASHNPAAYNGFKICREHAIPVGGDTGLARIEALAAAPAGPPRAPRGGRRRADVRERYVGHLLALAEGAPRLRVAIDCGNGMAAVGLEPLLERLPLEVERLHFEPDGTFPNHDANPLEAENLRDLVAAVRRTGARLGVAFDGDADRAIFVDERGEPVGSDLVTGLLGARLLRRHPGARVLYDLRSSRATAEAIEAAGGVAEMCRVGHSFFKARMRETGAVFGGELSGHFYFRFSPSLVADDGLAAFVALLGLLAEARRPLSELVAPLRRYHASGEISRRVRDPAALLAAVEREHAGAGISHLDGLSVRHPDWWFNLRPSNTEPVLRLNLEATTEAVMRARRDELVKRMEAGG